MSSQTAAVSPLLAGKTAYVAVSGLAFGPALAAGLEAQGAKVSLIEDAQAGNFTSRAAVESAFAAAAAKGGPADVLVHAAARSTALKSAPLASLTAADFHEASDIALRATLYTLQAAHAQMRGRGGAIIVIGPALSLVGAQELVPLTTATEGQRSLVKSAARQWGGSGIRVNWIGIANAQYAKELAGKAPEVPELGPPPCALGIAPALATDVAPTLAFLGSSAGQSLTGVTLNLDGGDWMVP